MTDPLLLCSQALLEKARTLFNIPPDHTPYVTLGSDERAIVLEDSLPFLRDRELLIIRWNLDSPNVKRVDGAGGLNAHGGPRKVRFDGAKEGQKVVTPPAAEVSSSPANAADASPSLAVPSFKSTLQQPTPVKPARSRSPQGRMIGEAASSATESHIPKRQNGSPPLPRRISAELANANSTALFHSASSSPPRAESSKVAEIEPTTAAKEVATPTLSTVSPPPTPSIPEALVQPALPLRTEARGSIGTSATARKAHAARVLAESRHQLAVERAEVELKERLERERLQREEEEANARLEKERLEAEEKVRQAEEAQRKLAEEAAEAARKAEEEAQAQAEAEAEAAAKAEAEAAAAKAQAEVEAQARAEAEAAAAKVKAEQEAAAKAEEEAAAKAKAEEEAAAEEKRAEEEAQARAKAEAEAEKKREEEARAQAEAEEAEKKREEEARAAQALADEQKQTSDEVEKAPIKTTGRLARRSGRFSLWKNSKAAEETTATTVTESDSDSEVEFIGRSLVDNSKKQPVRAITVKEEKTATEEATPSEAERSSDATLVPSSPIFGAYNKTSAIAIPSLRADDTMDEDHAEELAVFQVLSSVDGGSTSSDSSAQASPSPMKRRHDADEEDWPSRKKTTGPSSPSASTTQLPERPFPSEAVQQAYQTAAKVIHALRVHPANTAFKKHMPEEFARFVEEGGEEALDFFIIADKLQTRAYDGEATSSESKVNGEQVLAAVRRDLAVMFKSSKSFYGSKSSEGQCSKTLEKFAEIYLEEFSRKSKAVSSRQTWDHMLSE